MHLEKPVEQLLVAIKVLRFGQKICFCQNHLLVISLPNCNVESNFKTVTVVRVDSLIARLYQIIYLTIVIHSSGKVTNYIEVDF